MAIWWLYLLLGIYFFYLFLHQLDKPIEKDTWENKKEHTSRSHSYQSSYCSGHNCGDSGCDHGGGDSGGCGG